MAVKINAEDLLPGMFISMKNAKPLEVTSVHIEDYGQLADERSDWVRNRGVAVKINGDLFLELGQKVILVPPRPKVDYSWDNKHECYVFEISVEGDFQVLVNGRDIGDGVIHVDAERVKELES